MQNNMKRAPRGRCVSCRTLIILFEFSSPRLNVLPQFLQKKKKLMGKIRVTCPRILFYFILMIVFIFLEAANKRKGLSNQEYSLDSERQAIFVVNRK